jgi:hypothetical protein
MISVNKISLCDTVNKKSPTPDSMRNCFSPVHTFTAYFHKIRVNPILPTNCVTPRTISTNYACERVELKQVFKHLPQGSHILLSGGF